MRENWLIYDPVSGRQIQKGQGDHAGAFEAAATTVIEPLVIIPLPSDAVPPAAGEPVSDVEAVRQGVWEAIKRKREKVIDDGAPVGGGKKVQTDLESRLNLAGLAVAAVLEGDSFTETITASDNTTVTVGKNQMIGIALAARNHVSAAHARARDLREQKDSATTVDQLLSIPIHEDWPGETPAEPPAPPPPAPPPPE
jgi:hypothetical protein